MDRIACHRAVEGLAADQDGVVSRRQLRQLGIDHDDVRREVESGRWAVRGTQTVALHRGALSVLARRWSAIWETISDPRVVASYKLSVGAAFAVACVNAVFGMIVAWRSVQPS